MMIVSKYDIADIVYLKTDFEQYQRMITGIRVAPNGIIYELSCGQNSTLHFEIEIITEKIIA